MHGLDLVLQFPAGHEHAAARKCCARMRETEWTVLAQFAAEVLALHESRAQGHRVVVVPAASAEADVMKALQLRSTR